MKAGSELCRPLGPADGCFLVASLFLPHDTITAEPLLILQLFRSRVMFFPHLAAVRLFKELALLMGGAEGSNEAGRKR